MDSHPHAMWAPYENTEHPHGLKAGVMSRGMEVKDVLDTSDTGRQKEGHKSK